MFSFLERKSNYLAIPGALNQIEPIINKHIEKAKKKAKKAKKENKNQQPSTNEVSDKSQNQTIKQTSNVKESNSIEVQTGKLLGFFQNSFVSLFFKSHFICLVFSWVKLINTKGVSLSFFCFDRTKFANSQKIAQK